MFGTERSAVSVVKRLLQRRKEATSLGFDKSFWSMLETRFLQCKHCLYRLLTSNIYAKIFSHICVNDLIATCLVRFHLNHMWVDTAVSILSLATDWSWTFARRRIIPPKQWRYIIFHVQEVSASLLDIYAALGCQRKKSS